MLLPIMVVADLVFAIHLDGHCLWQPIALRKFHHRVHLSTMGCLGP